MVPTRTVLIALFGAVTWAGCSCGSGSESSKPDIDSFTCPGALISSGLANVTVGWDVVGAFSVTIEPNLGSVNPNGGSVLVNSVPLPATFTLTATGLTGTTNTETCTVAL